MLLDGSWLPVLVCLAVGRRYQPMEDVGMWDDLGQESVEKGVVLVITRTEPNTSKHGRGGLSPQLGANKCKKIRLVRKR